MYQNPLDRAIGHFRVDSGMSQAEVADYVGLSMTAWRSKRSGKVAFTVPEFIRLAELLALPLEQVIDLLPEVNRPREP